jgi:hypothetical protein
MFKNWWKIINIYLDSNKSFYKKIINLAGKDVEGYVINEPLPPYELIDFAVVLDKS